MGRFELSGHDQLLAMITTIAGGIRIPGITDIPERREGLSKIAEDFFKNTQSWMDRTPSVSGNAKRTVDSLYRAVQCTFMAYRPDEFIAIQGHPQFSRRTQGKSSMILMLTAYLSNGEKGLRTAMDDVIDGAAGKSNDDSPIVCSGGTGSSMTDAVVINTADKVWGIEAEYWYLNYIHGRIKKQGHSRSVPSSWIE